MTSLEFAQFARGLGTAARRYGLTAPNFRSPPRQMGVNRSLRRLPAGAVVAVRLKGRTSAEVLADMIDGVIAANGINEVDAGRWRAKLFTAVT